MRLSTPFVSLILLATPLCCLQSCSKEDEKAPQPTFSVSVSQLTLMSAANSTASFTINASGAWEAEMSDSWLVLSSTRGNGNATISITALSRNDASSSRTALINIKSGQLEETITVTQLGEYESNCNVHFTETLALDRSIAYSLSFDSNVSYFYQGYAEVSETAGWTDEGIVENLIYKMDVNSAALDWTAAGIDDLMPGTEYLLCAVGFDSRGNRGDLTKIIVRTRDVKASDPWIEIATPSRDNLYFYWDTEPNGYTQSYYMISIPGEVGEDASYFTNAQVAYMLRELIAESVLEPAARGGSWSRDNLGAYNLFIATWGVDVAGQFSAQLNKSHWIWNIPASKPALHFPKVGKSGVKMMTREQKDKIKNNIILKKVEK